MTENAKLVKELPASVKRAKERHDEYMKAVRKVEKGVRKQDGRLVLDVAGADDAGVDRRLLEDLRASLEETNRKVAAGELLLDEVALTSDEGATAEDATTRAWPDVPAGSGRGITAFRTYWWGWQFYMNDNGTHALLGALLAGGAAAVTPLVASVVGAAVAPVLAVVLGVAAGVIFVICVAGDHDGIVFKGLWLPVAPVIWCQ